MTLSSVRCASGAEAARLLAGNPRARYLGGGTLVMRALNSGDQSFDTIVLADDPELGTIRASGDALVIGAGVTMSRILASRDAACLHAAARLVGGPAVRNAATVGGNLFAPSPYGDLATALLALDATVAFAEGGEQPLGELLAARGRGGPQRLVAAVAFRRPAEGDFRFAKVSRVKPKGISVIAIACHLPRSSEPRVAYGAMAQTPVRVAAVEAALARGGAGSGAGGGRAPDEAVIGEAMRVATEGLDPPSDAIASGWYRRAVAPVHLGRLLRGEGGR